MLGPDFGRGRGGRLVAVRMGVDRGGRVVAQVAVDVDHPGGDELAGAVDPRVARRDREIRAAYADDLAVGEQHRPVVDPPAGPVIDRRADQRGRHARVGLVGRGIGRVGIVVGARGLRGIAGPFGGCARGQRRRGGRREKDADGCSHSDAPQNWMKKGADRSAPRLFRSISPADGSSGECRLPAPRCPPRSGLPDRRRHCRREGCRDA